MTTLRVLQRSFCYNSLIMSNFAKKSQFVTALENHGFKEIIKPMHTSAPKNDLMEFFDDEKNWGADIVRVGRAWKVDELRIKSNSDLHKLWYVLLKERNMLMTMEHESREAYELFPNEERLDKVRESMHNLEEVVIERNKAFHELETGETGMQPAKEVTNQIGMNYFYRMAEHVVPKYVNSKWNKTHVFKDNYNETEVFLRLLGEKNLRRERHTRRCQERHILGLMRRFPDLDLEAVKEKFPNIDVDKLAKRDDARGNWNIT